MSQPAPSTDSLVNLQCPIPISDYPTVTLAHGGGGRLTQMLIERMLLPAFSNPQLASLHDGALLAVNGARLAFSTDSFVISPLFFPGGDIGSLAVHGVVNDLAVCGAEPRYLTLSAIIEEGLEWTTLDRLVASFARAAREAGAVVACGDTKVVRHGEGGGLYLSVAGIGELVAQTPPSPHRICEGDTLLVSGPVGDHGIAVMLAREQFGLSGNLKSDSASVLTLTRAVWDLPGMHFLRDPTRGGLATVAHEIARATQFGVVLEQARIPVRDAVTSVCEMLGYDPYYLACEGRVVAVARPDIAEEVLRRWHALPGGELATRIGHIEGGKPRVTLATALGGRRLLDELEDDPLPRIC